MSELSTLVRDKVNHPETRKVIKYGMVSGVAIGVTLTVQFVCYGLFHLGPFLSQVIASTSGAIPSFYLNRSWVWGKSGKSHLRKEVIPFWIMTIVGFLFSLGATTLTDHLAQQSSHLVRSFLIPLASFTAYGVLWIGKFIIFNKILFVNHEDDLDPVLDGRSGIPT